MLKTIKKGTKKVLKTTRKGAEHIIVGTGTAIALTGGYLGAGIIGTGAALGIVKTDKEGYF